MVFEYVFKNTLKLLTLHFDDPKNGQCIFYHIPEYDIPPRAATLKWYGYFEYVSMESSEYTHTISG